MPKTIIEENGKIYLKYAWFKIALKRDEFLIHYEPLFFLAKHADERGLVLHIRKSSIFKIGFRNKIRLTVLPPNSDVLKNYIAQIEEMTGYKILKFDQEIF